MLKTNNFETIVKNEGIGDYSSRSIVNLGVSGVANPYNYTWSNVSNPRIVQMIPSVTYIDSFLGENSSSGLDGGNKVYTDYYTDLGEYTLKINVQGIAGPRNTITNNQCKLNVGEVNLLYRPIDVSNPFINASWKKGVNWTNEEYDFTKTIHASTWSGGSLYSIYLTDSQIEDLRSSTSSNRDQLPYYGLCNNPKISNKDNVTQYICGQIN